MIKKRKRYAWADKSTAGENLDFPSGAAARDFVRKKQREGYIAGVSEYRVHVSPFKKEDYDWGGNKMTSESYFAKVYHPFAEQRIKEEKEEKIEEEIQKRLSEREKTPQNKVKKIGEKTYIKVVRKKGAKIEVRAGGFRFAPTGRATGKLRAWASKSRPRKLLRA